MKQVDLFFAALNYAMFKQGLNDTQLAEKAGYSKQYMSRIRQGDRPLTEGSMKRLAGAVGFLQDDLVSLGERLEAAASGVPAVPTAPAGEPNESLKDQLIAAQAKTIGSLEGERNLLREKVELLECRLADKVIVEELVARGRAPDVDIPGQ